MIFIYSEKVDITLEQIDNWDKENIVFIDTRGRIAYYHGHIDNAILLEDVQNVIKSISLDSSKKYIVYCTYGETSYDIALELRRMGYEVYNLKGGYREWLKKNVTSFNEDELVRYDRQIILPQIGIEGQRKLKKARVLIVGAGGLGAPVALYLAGSGIGKIGLMDADLVSLSNLQRQIIFEESMVNKNKAESAKEVLQKLNHGITVTPYNEFLTPENAEKIISEYDFIVDAVDNFETKFLINDTCVLLEKPFCHAGILQFQGQVMTYVPNMGPCYRCIFQEIPDKSSIPNCSQAGVIGAMAGIIGSIQALETIKFFTGAGELLINKMFVFDGLSMHSRIVEFPNRNIKCRVCGNNADIKSVKDNQSEYQITSCIVEQKG